MSNDLECPSCQCTFDDPLQLTGCTHTMCKECIKSWSRHSKELYDRALQESVTVMGMPDGDWFRFRTSGEMPRWNDRCALCQGREHDHDDLVLCGRCEVAVHTGCYHIMEVPPGEQEWYCEPCEDALGLGPKKASKAKIKDKGADTSSSSKKKSKNNSQSAAAASSSSSSKAASSTTAAASSRVSPRKSIKSTADLATPPPRKSPSRTKKPPTIPMSSRQKCCVCCNRSDKALKRVKNADYIHLTCASFLPGPEFVDQISASPVDKVCEIPRQWFAQDCAFCHGPGATVQCQYGRCVKTYHVPCGLQNGCLFSIKEVAPGDGSGKDLEPDEKDEGEIFKDNVCMMHRAHIREVANAHDKKAQRLLKTISRKNTGKRKKNGGGGRQAKPKFVMPCPVCRKETKIDFAHETLGLTVDKTLLTRVQQHKLFHPDEESELQEIISKFSSSRPHDGDSSSSSEDETIHERGGGSGTDHSRRTPPAANGTAARGPVTSTSSTPSQLFTPSSRAAASSLARLSSPNGTTSTNAPSSRTSNGRANVARRLLPSSLDAHASSSRNGTAVANSSNSKEHSGKRSHSPSLYEEFVLDEGEAGGEDAGVPAPSKRKRNDSDVMDLASGDEEDATNGGESKQSEEVGQCDEGNDVDMNDGDKDESMVALPMQKRAYTEPPAAASSSSTNNLRAPQSGARAISATTTSASRGVKRRVSDEGGGNHAPFDLEIDGLEILEAKQSNGATEPDGATSSSMKKSPSDTPAATATATASSVAPPRKKQKLASLNQHGFIPATVTLPGEKKGASSCKQILRQLAKAHYGNECKEPSSAAGLATAAINVWAKEDASSMKASTYHPHAAAMNNDPFMDPQPYLFAQGLTQAPGQNDVASEEEVLVRLESYAIHFQTEPVPSSASASSHSSTSTLPTVSLDLRNQLHSLRVVLRSAQSMVSSGRILPGALNMLDPLESGLQRSLARFLTASSGSLLIGARKSTRNKDREAQQIDALLKGYIDPVLALGAAQQSALTSVATVKSLPNSKPNSASLNATPASPTPVHASSTHAHVPATVRPSTVTPAKVHSSKVSHSVHPSPAKNDHSPAKTEHARPILPVATPVEPVAHASATTSILSAAVDAISALFTSSDSAAPMEVDMPHPVSKMDEKSESPAAAGASSSLPHQEQSDEQKQSSTP